MKSRSRLSLSEFLPQKVLANQPIDQSFSTGPLSCWGSESSQKLFEPSDLKLLQRVQTQMSCSAVRGIFPPLPGTPQVSVPLKSPPGMRQFASQVQPSSPPLQEDIFRKQNMFFQSWPPRVVQNRGGYDPLMSSHGTQFQSKAQVLPTEPIYEGNPPMPCNLSKRFDTQLYQSSNTGSVINSETLTNSNIYYAPCPQNNTFQGKPLFSESRPPSRAAPLQAAPDSASGINRPAGIYAATPRSTSGNQPSAPVLISPLSENRMCHFDAFRGAIITEADTKLELFQKLLFLLPRGPLELMASVFDFETLTLAIEKYTVDALEEGSGSEPVKFEGDCAAMQNLNKPCKFLALRSICSRINRKFIVETLKILLKSGSSTDSKVAQTIRSKTSALICKHVMAELRESSDPFNPSRNIRNETTDSLGSL